MHSKCTINNWSVFFWRDYTQSINLTCQWNIPPFCLWLRPTSCWRWWPNKLRRWMPWLMLVAMGPNSIERRKRMDNHGNWMGYLYVYIYIYLQPSIGHLSKEIVNIMVQSGKASWIYYWNIRYIIRLICVCFLNWRTPNHPICWLVVMLKNVVKRGHCVTSLLVFVLLEHTVFWINFAHGQSFRSRN